MKTTEYLYGVQPHVFRNMKYENAIELKHTLAKKMLRDVNKQYFENKGSWDETINARKHIADLSKAVAHNAILLEELKGSEDV